MGQTAVIAAVHPLFNTVSYLECFVAVCTLLLQSEPSAQETNHQIPEDMLHGASETDLHVR